MRSALLPVFFALSAIRCWGITIPADFRPTLIPLEWRGIPAEREHRALDETEDLPTESSITVKIPPHYWEDALRHSVYLTLVRDNIDALIARGEVIFPNQSKHSLPQELEDKDLWDKIKGASFDRIPADESPPFGDVSLVSSGKLVEEDGKYKFSETDKNTPECYDCEIDAKALWSVKRMRHREFDTPGRYRYELTFSVVTQPSKQTRKPHENPARTFTVRESSPETVNDDPRENRAARKQRAEKALWFHKNIYEADEWAPQPPHGTVEIHPKEIHRQTDRMFTSLFRSDEKPRVYTHYERDDAQRKYVNIRGPNSQYPPPPQIHKQKKPQVDHQQKKLTPYPYKPHGPQKLQRPQNIPVPHVQHHYLDIDAIGVVSSPYVSPPQDNRFAMPTKQKYAVPIHAHYPHVQPPAHFQSTPRPLLPAQQTQQPSWSNVTEPAPVTQNVTKSTPKPSELTVLQTKPKPTSIRIGYVTDHVRPPVYNTPPGVFVTMDKKPFKPLPPMKLHQLPKLSRPADFRPSPQVLDIHFSEPDPLFESFRPIFNFTRPSESTTEAVVAESTKNVEKIVETETNNETVSSTSAPPRRTRITSTTTTSTTTTTTTEPPPSSTYEDIETMSWTNLLGAFTGTTPSDITKPITKKYQTTEPTAKASPSSTTVKEPEPLITTTSSTTVKPTRPPYNPKKKHKRVTTTTTTTTTTTKVPRTSVVEKPSTESAFILSSTEGLERTTTPGYRQIPSTSTVSETAPIRESEPKLEYPPKPKNRYRLSTLMTKGTSVKHDKWSSQASEQKPVIEKASPVLGKYSSRRITSNFLGYSSSTTERGAVKIAEENNHEHVAHITSPVPKTTSSTEAPSNPEFEDFESTRDFDDQANEEFINSEKDDLLVNAMQKQKQKTKEKLESLFRPRPSNIFSLKTNDRMNNDETTTTQKTIIASPHSNPKNATKCKKKNGKKPINSKTTEIPEIITTEVATIEPVPQTTNSTTTEAPVASDIFEELFGEASNNVPPSSAPESDISKDDNYKDDNYKDEVESDIFNDFFGVQDDDIKSTSPDNETLDYDEDIKERESFDHVEDLKEKEHHDHDFEYPETALDDILNDAEETTTPTSNYASGDESSYSEFSERPYSIFELMAME